MKSKVNGIGFRSLSIVTFAALACLVFLYSNVDAAMLKSTGSGGREKTVAKHSGGWPNAQQRVHRVCKANMCVTNWGFLGSQMRDIQESKGGCFNPDPDHEHKAPSFEFPAGSGLEYLFQGSLWIGAMVNDTPYVSVGCDGWQWIYELWPDSGEVGGIKEKSTDSSRSCYSQDATSRQDIIAVYTDTSADIPLSPQTHDPFDQRKHFPLDVRISQKSYSWSVEGYDDFIIAEYNIENIGNHNLKDVYIGFYMDCDVQHVDEYLGGPYAFQDDITGFRHLVTIPKGDRSDTANLAWIADNDGHGSLDGGANATVFTDKSPTSVIGVKILYPPNSDLHFSYNWWFSNQDGYPKDWGPWRRQSQERWARENPYEPGKNTFPDNVLGTPGGDFSKYFILSNGEFDYDQIFACTWPTEHPDEGWLEPSPVCSDFADGYDTRFLLSFGPFDHIYPNESLRFGVAFVMGENFHTNPTNGKNLPNNPLAYYANLNFTDLENNAIAAQRLWDCNLKFPIHPSDFKVKATTDTTITLKWTAVTDRGITGYNLYRRLEGETYGDSLAYVEQPEWYTITFTDSNVNIYERYYYVVTSISALGESDSSKEISAVPGVPLVIPSGVKVYDRGDGNSLKLQWIVLPEGDVSGFNIYYGTTSGVYTDTVHIGNVLEHVQSGLTEGQTYFLAIAAHNALGKAGDPSAEVLGTPRSIPQKPDSVWIRPGGGIVGLGWSPSLALDLVGYKIYRSESDSLHFQFLAGISSPDSVHYEDITVTNSVNYYYGVSAVDQDSNESGKTISEKVTPNPSQIGDVHSVVDDGLFGWGNGDFIANVGEALLVYFYAKNIGTTWILNPKAVVHADDPYVMQVYKETDTLYCENDIAPGQTEMFRRVLKDYPEARYWRYYVLTISSNCPSGHEFHLPVDFYDSQGNFLGKDSIDFTVTGSDSTPPRAIDVKCRPQLATSGIDTIFALIEDGAVILGAHAEVYNSQNDSLTAMVTLNDKGISGDKVAGDRIFSGIYVDTTTGDFYVNISATDFYDNSYTSKRLAGFSTAPLDTEAEILFYHCYVRDPYSLWAHYNPVDGIVTIPYSKDKYLKTLDSLAETYAIWDQFFRGEIPDTILNDFADKKVIFVDDGGGGGFPPNTQENLINLLKSGGRLFVSGGIMGRWLAESEFYRDYLLSNFVAGVVGLYGMAGDGVVGIPRDSITSGVYFPYIKPPAYAEEIDPIPPATPILKYHADKSLSSGTAALKVDNGIYKLVYASFGLDVLSDSCRYVLLEKILHWLDASSEAVPQLSISIFQNSVLTKYIDLYVNSTVELKQPPLSRMTIGSNAPDTITLSELAPQTYQGNYILTTSGTCSLFVSALSDFGIAKDTVKLFDVQLIESKSAGKLVSHDGKLELIIPFGSVPESTYFTCIPLSEEKSGSPSQLGFLGIPYQLGPSKRSFENSLTIVFPLEGYNLTEEEKSRICVYKQEKDKWIMVDSYLDYARNNISAKVKELGLYRLGYSQSEPQASLPKRYELFQNYPNPFNPNTVIKYNLHHAGNVKLTIYNILGQKVKTLVNEHQEAGYKSIIWDGKDERQKDVASGIYFYRIEVGDEYTAVKKMVLIK
jgi:hypothetical protein